MSDTATATPTTESVVLDLLRENTGRHLLDSGDYYGRHWQQNQSVDFDLLPSTTLSFRFGVEVTHYLHAWLPERLSYEQAGDEAWLEWASAREDEAWLQSAERWAEILGGAGIYGDGAPLTVNTYNGEDLLSQTIQYVYFTLEQDTPLPAPGAEGRPEGQPTCAYCERPLLFVDCTLTDDTGKEACEGTGSGGEHEEADEPSLPEGTVTLSAGTYALLQIHGGADVRGGYTKPRLFSLGEYDETALLDNARATIVCSETRDHNWYTDDGYNWYFDGATGHTDLKDYDRVEVDFTEGDLKEPAVADPAARVGKLVIDTDSDTGYCPVCGVGTLSAGW